MVSESLRDKTKMNPVYKANYTVYFQPKSPFYFYKYTRDIVQAHGFS